MATPVDNTETIPREWSASNPFRRQLMADSPRTPELPATSPKNASEATLDEIDTNKQSSSPPSSSSKTASPPVKYEEEVKEKVETDDPFDVPDETLATTESEETKSVDKDRKPSKPRPAPRPFVSFGGVVEEKPDTRSVTNDLTPRQKLAAHPGRASLDVDAFKRLMLTGSAGTVPTPSNDNSSATSSLSKQSLFETIPESADSPRSSHDVLDEPDVEKKREKPAPPKPRHGKLIQSQQTEEPDRIKNKESENRLEESVSGLAITGLDKSLPPLPTVDSTSSIEKEDTPFPKIDISKLPPPESPTVSTPTKKVAPPPPINRRASMINRAKSSSSVSSLSLTSTPSNRPSSISSAQGIPAMGSKPPPTPPAPRRRQSNASIASRDMLAIQENQPLASPELSHSALIEEGDDRHDSLGDEGPSGLSSLSLPSTPKTKPSLPPPRPPTRAPSSAKRNKPARNSVLLPSTSNPSPGSMAPPPPPKPRRASGGSTRSSLDDGRRASASSTRIDENSEENIDYLAEEVKKLQAEVDALRGKMSGGE